MSTLERLADGCDSDGRFTSKALLVLSLAGAWTVMLGAGLAGLLA